MEMPAVQTRKMHLTELTFIIFESKAFLVFYFDILR